MIKLINKLKSARVVYFIVQKYFKIFLPFIFYYCTIKSNAKS
jgi:hypothetical protein